MVADDRILVHFALFRRVIYIVAPLALLLVGCQTPATPKSAPTAEARTAATSIPDASSSDGTETATVVNKSTDDADTPRPTGLTNHRLDGNRVVDGYTDLTTITPIDVELEGVPVWVAAVPAETGVLWGVVLDDGRTQAVLVADGAVTPVPTQPEQLSVAMPPLLEYIDGVAVFVLPRGEASPVTNAVPVGDALIGVESDGDLIIEDADTTKILDTDALPDARILVDDAERVLFVSNPTHRYSHGVLGDRLEASAIILAEIEPEPRVVRTIEIPESRVLEGIAPIWADLDGDGGREILATLSDAIEGARIVVYGEDGSVIAEGPPVGQGYRWRHQIAVAPFGPQRQLELAAVLTPHIGGVVEFYALNEGQLEIVASLKGFTSHVLGSRNLDMAVAANPAGEAQAVLLAPSQDRNQLGAIRHGEDGAETAWMVDVDGMIVTNVGAASLDDDQLGVSVGRNDGVLRIWQPDDRMVRGLR